MLKFKVLFITLIMILGFFYLMMGCFSSNNIAAVSSFDLEKTNLKYAEQTILKYLSFVNEGELTKLSEIYVIAPESYWQKPTDNSRETNVSSLSQSVKKPNPSPLTDLFFDFYSKRNPSILKNKGLHFDEFVEREVQGDIIRIRVLYKKEGEPSIHTQDFFLTKNNGEWKIFRIMVVY